MKRFNGQFALGAVLTLGLLGTQAHSAFAGSNQLSYAGATLVYDSTNMTFGTDGKWEKVPVSLNGVPIGTYYLNTSSTLTSGSLTPGASGNQGALTGITTQLSSTASSAGDIFSMTSPSETTFSFGASPNGTLVGEGGAFTVLTSTTNPKMSSPGTSFGLVGSGWNGTASNGFTATFSSPAVPEASSVIGMSALLFGGGLISLRRNRRARAV